MQHTLIGGARYEGQPTHLKAPGSMAFRTRICMSFCIRFSFCVYKLYSLVSRCGKRHEILVLPHRIAMFLALSHHVTNRCSVQRDWLIYLSNCATYHRKPVRFNRFCIQLKLMKLELSDLMPILSVKFVHVSSEKLNSCCSVICSKADLNVTIGSSMTSNSDC